MSTLASIDLVRNVQVFATLNERHLAAIVERCRLKSVHAGTPLVTAGLAPDRLSILVSGQVRVLHDRGGTSVPLDVLGRGAHFGETALDSTPAPFSVQSLTDCELLTLSREDLAQLAVESPEIDAVLDDFLLRRDQPDPDPPPPGARSDAPKDTPFRDAPGDDDATAFVNPPVGDDGLIQWQRKAYEGARRRRGRRPPLPRQARPTDAGPACLAAVCRHYGKRVSVTRLREACDAVQSGASLTGLRRAAEANGFETFAARTPDQLTTPHLPAIASLTSGRWAVVYAADGDQVAMIDPTSGPRTLRRAEFLEAWAGEVLYLRPTPMFADIVEARPALSRVLPYLRPLKAVIGELLLASVLMQVLALALPIFARFAIDDVIGRRDDRWLLPAVGAMAGVVALSCALSLSRRYLLQFVSRQVDTRLGADVYKHLLELPLRFFERRAVGDIVSRLEEAGKLTEFLTGPGPAFLIDIVTATLGLALMAHYSPTLTVVVLAFVAVEIAHLVWVTPALSRGLREAFQEGRDAEGLLIESFVGLRTIKVLAAEPYVRWGLESRLVRSINKSLTTLKYGTVATATSRLLHHSSALAVLFYGAVLVLRHELTVGELVAVVLLAQGLTTPFATLASVWDRLQDTRHSVEQLTDVFEAPVEPGVEPADRVVLHRLHGHVKLEGVWFRYTEDGPDVIRDVDIEAFAGQRVAIVGPSGSGKSTLVRLLMGFYAPTRGRVSMDGFDLAEVWLPSLRRQMGVALQDPVLFKGTIRDNISLSLPAASLHEVIVVARMVNAHAWVTRLPRGYETLLEENGSNLSGGQRQQIAIARSLLQHRRVLLIDEATSNIDSESERLLHQNVDLRFKDSTIITVTQRLHAIRRADVIVVLDRGTVVEQGDHDHLMARRGLYAGLYAQQHL